MITTFKYKGLSKDGVEVSGVVEAYDEYEAVTKIKDTCPVVIKVAPVRQANDFLNMEIGSKKVSEKSLSVMCSQFSIILKAGMPVAVAVDLIADQTEDKKLRGILERVATEVSAGRSLAAGFEVAAKEAFPISFFETVRAGESAGTLDTAFDSLTVYYEKRYKVKQSVSNALIYPIFVLIVGIVVLAVVMVKVIPTIKDMFSDLGGELPLMTKIMIAISDFMTNHFLVILLIIALLIIAYQIAIRQEKGRIFFSELKLKGKVMGNIRTLNAAGAFANTLSTLLKAGLQLPRAISVTGKTLENYALDKKIQMMSTDIEDGKSFGSCMRQIKYFPKGLVEMCAIGENSGELEETLAMIGAYYDNESENATKKMLAKLEPAMIVVMAIFAGFIVISIYLPIFEMYGLM